MNLQIKKPVYLFFGETYLSQQKLKFWQDQFIKKYGNESLEILNGAEIDLGEVMTNIEAIPFFSEKRLIIIKDFLEFAKAEDQKRVAEGIARINENCILIFYENETPERSNSLLKKISKIGHIEEFKTLSPNELSKFILERAKKENIKISFGQANYLVQHCGSNLWTLTNELEKLQTYANGQNITNEMIETLCPISISASVFKLTDSIAQKDLKNSLKTFETLKESGEDLIKVFFMIVRHFRILIQVNELLSKGEKAFDISKKLNLHSFVIQKTSGQSKNFTIEKLIDIYQKLLEIDTKTKTGVIKTFASDNRQFLLAIEELIIDCCRKS